jgi:integrase
MSATTYRKTKVPAVYEAIRGVKTVGYQARPTAEGRRLPKKTFRTLAEAKRHLDAVRTDVQRGTYVDATDKTTVAEYARSWSDSRPYRKNTKKLMDNLITVHLEGTTLGGRPMVKVKPSEVQSWITERAKLLAASSLRRMVGQLRSIFASAVLDGARRDNPVLPARRLALPQAEQPKLIPLTVEQVRALAAAMPERYRALVLTQAGLGLRISEVLALRAADVDFLRRNVQIEHQLERETLRRVVTKTPQSRREIPLPTMVSEALAAHIANYPLAEDGSVFTQGPHGGRQRCEGAPANLRQQSYGAALRKAAGLAAVCSRTDCGGAVELGRETCQRCGAKAAGLPKVKTHDLRHHYASVLLHAGESVHAVAERLGHSDATLVLTTYGHLMPNQEDRTRKAVDAAWKQQAGGEISAAG